MHAYEYGNSVILPHLYPSEPPKNLHCEFLFTKTAPPYLPNMLLSVQDLCVSFPYKGDDNEVVHGITFSLKKGETLALVGESGSGKSLTALSILGLLPGAAQIAGSIQLDEQELTSLDPDEYRKLRGSRIGMIFQEPMSSLNPSMTCGQQVMEVLRNHDTSHLGIDAKEYKYRVLELFEQVQLPRPEAIYDTYPHQISGGQKQRVMIAMAIALDPVLLIADEPTTALDVTVQQEILELLESLQQIHGMAMLFISHDLAVVQDIAHYVGVMNHGNLVELQPSADLFTNPQHPYTKALLASRPSGNTRLKTLPTIQDVYNNTMDATLVSPQERAARLETLYAQEPLLEINNLDKTYLTRAGLFGTAGEVKAVQDVSIKIYPGETLGLVGESGCGKSTLGAAILGLTPPTDGTILYRGVPLAALSRKRKQELHREIQIIFQDPFASLNPRITIGEAIREPMQVHKLYGNRREQKQRVLELLFRVGLEDDHYDRYPHEFSGGQRQRIGIARTIAVNPKLIVCDESVSALDISVQAQVLNLLNELKADFGFTYLFISHDLAVVRYMSDNLIVMREGKVVERGEADHVYEHPHNPYTRSLIDAIPGKS